MRNTVRDVDHRAALRVCWRGGNHRSRGYAGHGPLHGRPLCRDDLISDALNAEKAKARAT